MTNGKKLKLKYQNISLITAMSFKPQWKGYDTGKGRNGQKSENKKSKNTTQKAGFRKISKDVQLALAPTYLIVLFGVFLEN